LLNLAHKNLEVWKKSVALVSAVYKLTRSFPESEKYGLSSQMRRTAVSIASNIAEGASRRTDPDQQRFYVIARSSAVEIDTQVEIALELGCLEKNEVEGMSQLLNHVFAMLTGLIKRFD
jgi:four helix bundle protein